MEEHGNHYTFERRRALEIATGGEIERSHRVVKVRVGAVGDVPAHEEERDEIRLAIVLPSGERLTGIAETSAEALAALERRCEGVLHVELPDVSLEHHVPAVNENDEASVERIEAEALGAEPMTLGAGDVGVVTVEGPANA